MFNKAINLNHNKLNYKNTYNKFNLNYWRQNHQLACFDSLKSLYYAPFSNLLTMFILGVTFALPILLYLIILNLNASVTVWQQGFYQFSIYADSSLTEQQISDLNKTVTTWPEIEKLQMISQTEGLQELQNTMGIDDIFKNIEKNPLPSVLVASVKPEFKNIKDIKELLDRSGKLPGVIKTDADLLWLEKIINILRLSSVVIYSFSLALSLAVLLVISNTIRLMLQHKEKEMTVYCLLGATHAYIRRPYLYGGMFYGLFTGLLGLVVAHFIFNELHNMISKFEIYNFTNVHLESLSIVNIVFLLAFTSFLGWLGARMTLYFQLKNLKTCIAEV